MTDQINKKMPKCLVFGYFDVLMPGHLSFLGKAKAMCEHLTVALGGNGILPENTLEKRKIQLLGSKLVDNIVYVKDFSEIGAIIKTENIDIYAYGNPKWLIETLDCKIIHIKSSRFFLEILNVSVGHACTLKCQHCSALSPFAPKDVQYYNIDKIIDSLKKLTSVADINKLDILGGEAFLHPSLTKLLTYIIDSSEIMNVSIITNGTILPKVSIDVLTNPKITVRISANSKYSEKQDKLINYLDENGVKHFFWIADNWTDFDHPRQTDKKAEMIFSCCHNKISCLALENGVMGYCTQSVIAPRVKGFLPKKGDYLYVNESTDLKIDLYNYVHHPKYMEACKYCSGTEGPKVEPALQLQH